MRTAEKKQMRLGSGAGMRSAGMMRRADPAGPAAAAAENGLIRALMKDDAKELSRYLSNKELRQWKSLSLSERRQVVAAVRANAAAAAAGAAEKAGKAGKAAAAAKAAKKATGAARGAAERGFSLMEKAKGAASSFASSASGGGDPDGVSEAISKAASASERAAGAGKDAAATAAKGAIGAAKGGYKAARGAKRAIAAAKARKDLTHRLTVKSMFKPGKDASKKLGAKVIKKIAMIAVAVVKAALTPLLAMLGAPIAVVLIVFLVLFPALTGAAEAKEQEETMQRQALAAAIIEDEEKAKAAAAGGYADCYKFPTYDDLTESQIIAIAVQCASEQGAPEGAKAEASQMANCWELNKGSCQDKYANLYEYVKNSGNWSNSQANMADAKVSLFQGMGAVRAENGSTLTQDVYAAVRSALVDGKRNLPLYCDVHDSKKGGRDGAAYFSNDGGQTWATYENFAPASFEKGKTLCRYKETYTFYAFPVSGSDPNSWYGYCDPFGYTDWAYAKAAEIAMASFEGFSMDNVPYISQQLFTGVWTGNGYAHGEYLTMRYWSYINPACDRTVSDDGCGVCSGAMAASAVLGRLVTPAEEGFMRAYQQSGSGTVYAPLNRGQTYDNWPAFFAKFDEIYGTSTYCSRIGSDEASIMAALQRGSIVIIHVGPQQCANGHVWTSGGHIMLLVGTVDGKLALHDPARPDESYGKSGKLILPSELIPAIGHAFEIRAAN